MGFSILPKDTLARREAGDYTTKLPGGGQTLPTEPLQKVLEVQTITKVVSNLKSILK